MPVAGRPDALTQAAGLRRRWPWPRTAADDRRTPADLQPVRPPVQISGRLQHLTPVAHLVGMVMELGVPLVRAAAAGDAEAFTRIVAAYHRDMVRVAFTITGDPDTADDAVQSAWSIAWKQLRTHREDASLRSWLLKIAANEARQTVRRSNRRGVREIAVDEVTWPTDDALGSDAPTRLDLADALARLSVDDRTLLALRYAADLNSDEIARLLGGTATGIRSRLSRLLHRLREELDHA